MSTVDPNERRRTSLLDRRVVVAGLAGGVAVLFIAAGYGLATEVLDNGRVASTNHASAWDTPREGFPYLLTIGLFGGVYAATSLGRRLRARRRRSITLGLAWFYALAAVALTGVTVGLLCALPAWTAPHSVGESGADGITDAQPWGWSAWVWYYLPYLLPPIFAAGAAVLGFLYYRTTLARTRLIERGVKARGVVTAVRPTGRVVVGEPTYTVTVKFTDQQGTERWIQRTVGGDGRVAVEETVDVWFDPSTPDDDGRIVMAKRGRAR